MYMCNILFNLSRQLLNINIITIFQMGELRLRVAILPEITQLVSSEGDSISAWAPCLPWPPMMLFHLMSMSPPCKGWTLFEAVGSCTLIPGD